ncbi:MAG: phosphatase PAP2 family protein [Gemmatimonadaceae bacterium]|nr:phosphatase PAP2 family protein [Gemmatimonadaceae bacterium]
MRLVPIARREVVALSAFTATSLALLPFDRRLAHRLAMNPARPGTGARWADRIATIGDPGSVLVAGSALLVGYGLRRPTVADVGRHLSEAIMLSGTLTAGAKVLIGRVRPRTAGLDAPFMFTPLRPSGGHVSYPSGHTSAAFTTAAVLEGELAHSRYAARHQGWATTGRVALYTAAAAVGTARVIQRAHWTSDVVAGAGLGIASGWWAVRMGHRPRARVANAAR